MGSLESRPSWRAVNGRPQHRRKSCIYQKGYSKIRDCWRRGTPDLLMEKHFIPENNKEDALSNTRTPIIPQRETYVTKSEQGKSVTNQEGAIFLVPCHPHYHSQLLQCRSTVIGQETESLRDTSEQMIFSNIVQCEGDHYMREMSIWSENSRFHRYCSRMESCFFLVLFFLSRGLQCQSLGS